MRVSEVFFLFVVLAVSRQPLFKILFCVWVCVRVFEKKRLPTQWQVPGGANVAEFLMQNQNKSKQTQNQFCVWNKCCTYFFLKEFCVSNTPVLR